MLQKVQCQKCKTPFAYDDSRIQGHGAQVTCPKCRNVFVVLKDSDGIKNNEDEDSQNDEERTVIMSMPKDGSDDKKVAPNTATKRQPTSLHQTNPATTNRSDTDKTVIKEHPSQNLPQVQRPESVDVLNWKEVGLNSFKVRVAIGMVYDFSDVSTMKKYVAEKRIVATDRISFDGKTWHTIKEIPDLESFFIDQWVILKQQKLLDASSHNKPSNVTNLSTPPSTSPITRPPTSPNISSKKISVNTKGLSNKELFGDDDEDDSSSKGNNSKKTYGSKTTHARTTNTNKQGSSASKSNKPSPAALDTIQAVIIALLLGFCFLLGWKYSQLSAKVTEIQKTKNMSADKIKIDKLFTTYFPITLNMEPTSSDSSVKENIKEAPQVK